MYSQCVLVLSAVVLVNADSQIRNLTPRALHCLSQNKLLSRIDELCYFTGTQGPCKDNEMFVLDEKYQGFKDVRMKLSTTCKKRKCAEYEIEVEDTGKCIAETDSLCDYMEGVVLTTNEYGYAECRCQTNFVRLGSRKTGPCYELYYRGPCEEGQHVGFIKDFSIIADCVPDPCYNELQRRRKTGQVNNDEIMVTWSHDDDCYVLNQRGPCIESYSLVLQNFELGCLLDDDKASTTNKQRVVCNGECSVTFQDENKSQKKKKKLRRAHNYMSRLISRE